VRCEEQSQHRAGGSSTNHDHLTLRHGARLSGGRACARRNGWSIRRARAFGDTELVGPIDLAGSVAQGQRDAETTGEPVDILGEAQIREGQRAAQRLFVEHVLGKEAQLDACRRVLYAETGVDDPIATLGHGSGGPG